MLRAVPCHKGGGAYAREEEPAPDRPTGWQPSIANPFKKQYPPGKDRNLEPKRLSFYISLLFSPPTGFHANVDGTFWESGEETPAPSPPNPEGSRTTPSFPLSRNVSFYPSNFVTQFV